MPIYEYACKGCGHEFEREQRISDAPIKKCPSCGALKARRQISRTSFVLKGGGWYSDLYGAPAKPADDATPAKDAKEAKEAKPAADAGDKPAAAPSAADAGAKSDSGSPPPPKKGGKKVAAA